MVVCRGQASAADDVESLFDQGPNEDGCLEIAEVMELAEGSKIGPRDLWFQGWIVDAQDKRLHEAKEVIDFEVSRDGNRRLSDWRGHGPSHDMVGEGASGGRVGAAGDRDCVAVMDEVGAAEAFTEHDVLGGEDERINLGPCHSAAVVLDGFVVGFDEGLPLLGLLVSDLIVGGGWEIGPVTGGDIEFAQAQVLTDGAGEQDIGAIVAPEGGPDAAAAGFGGGDETGKAGAVGGATEGDQFALSGDLGLATDWDIECGSVGAAAGIKIEGSVGPFKLDGAAVDLDREGAELGDENELTIPGGQGDSLFG